MSGPDDPFKDDNTPGQPRNSFERYIRSSTSATGRETTSAASTIGTDQPASSETDLSVQDSADVGSRSVSDYSRNLIASSWRRAPALGEESPTPVGRRRADELPEAMYNEDDREDDEKTGAATAGSADSAPASKGTDADEGVGEIHSESKHSDVQETKGSPSWALPRSSSRASPFLTPIDEDTELDDDAHVTTGRGEAQAVLSTPVRNRLLRLQHEREAIFDLLYMRVREILPASRVHAIEHRQMGGHGPEPWQPADIERITAEGIEVLRRELDQPANGGAPIPLEVRNRITAQMHAIAAGIKVLVNESVVKYLTEDVTCIRRNIGGLAQLLDALEAFSGPKSSARSARGSRHQSILSNTSSPEAIIRGFERADLRKMAPAELIDIIMRQDAYLKDREQVMEDEIMKGETEIARLVDREDKLIDENKKTATEVREVKNELRRVYLNIQEGLNPDGTALAKPHSAGAKQRAQANRAREGRTQGHDENATDDEDAASASIEKQNEAEGSTEHAMSFSKPSDAMADDAREDFEVLQAAMLSAEEEYILSNRYVSYTRHKALQEALEAELARGFSMSESASEPDACDSNRASTTGSDGLTRRQLQTRLRMVEDERDALRGDQSRRRAAQGIRADHDQKRLIAKSRQRAIKMGGLSARPFLGFNYLFAYCGQATASFAQQMVDIGQVNRGRGGEQVQSALEVVLDGAGRLLEWETNADQVQYMGDEASEDAESSQDGSSAGKYVFVNQFLGVFDDLQLLASSVDAWNNANPRDAQGRNSEDWKSRVSQESGSAASDSQSLISHATSGVPGRISSNERHHPRHGPLYTDPEWLLEHPNGEPCIDCRRVLRFPTDRASEAIDAGPCPCEHETVREPQSDPARSRPSASSRVSFADDLRSGSIASDASSRRSTRSILRKSRRGPTRLDVELANAGAYSDSSTRPGTPYPSSLSSAGRGAADMRRTTRTSDGLSQRSSGSRRAQPTQHGTQARRHTVNNAPGIPPDEFPAAPPAAERTFSALSRVSGTSNTSIVPITQPRRPCCAHFSQQSRICGCSGSCDDHWCCEHWQDTVGCRCGRTCGAHQCCDCWEPKEGPDGMCMCFSTCDAHRKCCSCGVTVEDDGSIFCNCGWTCQHHAVCNHYTPDKLELACMEGCELRKATGSCDHPATAVPGGSIPACQYPCEAHPCCEHWKVSGGRAYCGCGRGCNVHRCCANYAIFSNRLCECEGQCDAHVPLEMRERHYRNLEALASFAANSYLFGPPRLVYDNAALSDGGTPDWERTLRRDERKMVRRGLMDADGNMVPEDQRPFFGNARREQRQSRGRLTQLSGVSPKNGEILRGCGSQCRCRSGRMLEVLTRNDGPAFAFYTCTRSIKAADRSAPALSVPQTEDENPAVQTALNSAVADSNEPSRPGGPTRPRSLSVSSADGVSWTTAPSKISSFALQPKDSTQDIKNLSGVPEGGRRRSHSASSLRTPRQWSPQTSQDEPWSRTPANKTDFDDYQSAKSQRAAEDRQSDDGQSPDRRVPVGRRSGGSSRDDLPVKEPTGENSANGKSAGGGSSNTYGGWGPQPHQPQATGPPPGRRTRFKLSVFLTRLVQLVVEMLRILTWRPLCNLGAVVSYLVGMVYYVLLHIVDRLRGPPGRPTLRLRSPVLPRAQLLALARSLGLVWFGITMIAISEERRLWLAANPRTANYMRGLRQRTPYPWWSPFEVDYALLEPGLEWLSVWLHRAVFRPGLGPMFGLEENTLTDVVGNATMLAWVGVPLAAAL